MTKIKMALATMTMALAVIGAFAFAAVTPPETASADSHTYTYDPNPQYGRDYVDGTLTVYLGNDYDGNRIAGSRVQSYLDGNWNARQNAADCAGEVWAETYFRTTEDGRESVRTRCIDHDDD